MTSFHVLSALLDRLKNLFVLFFNKFSKDVISILNNQDMSSLENLNEDKELNRDRQLLHYYCLLCLYRFSIFDNSGCLTDVTCDNYVKCLVSYLKNMKKSDIHLNTIEIDSNMILNVKIFDSIKNDIVAKALTSCLLSLGTTIGSEKHWKSLNFKVINMI